MDLLTLSHAPKTKPLHGFGVKTTCGTLATLMQDYCMQHCLQQWEKYRRIFSILHMKDHGPD